MKGFATCAFVVAAFAVRSPASAAPTDAETMTTYVTQEGEGCEAIAEKLFGDPKRYDIVHRYNPNLGPQPHKFKAGTVLHVPSRSADAIVAFTRNQVRVESPAAHPAKIKDPLFRGNRVVTGPSSAAGIDFREDAELVLGEETLVIIFGATRASAQQTTASLVSGNLRSHLAELAGHKPASVSTPSADIALGSGDTRVSVDRANATRLAVYKGASSIAAQNKKIEVAQGFGSKAEKGLAPTPPRPLPAMPSWKRPPAALTMALGDAADVSAEYAPGSGGPAVARWHVQVGHDAEMRDVVVDTTVAAKVTTLEAKRLGAGAYFVRVSAIDDDAFEGPFGPAAKLAVAVVSMHRAAPNDRRIDVAIAPAGALGLRCAIDGAPLAAADEPHALTSTRAHRVTCAIPAAAPTGVASATGATAEPTVFATIPADHLGIVVGDARLTGAEGARELAVTLHDRDGRPVTDADIQATAPRGVELGPARVAGDRWIFPVRVARGITAFAIHFEVNGAEVAITQKVHVAAEPKPPPPAPEPSRIELAAGAVLGAVGERAREIGGGAQLTLGTSVPLESGDVAIGVRGGYELYRFRVDGGARYTDAVPLGVALAYRARVAGSRIAPFVSVVPQFVLYAAGASTAPGSPPNASSPNASSSNGAVPGVVITLGADLRAGAGAFFIDAGYRAVQSPDAPRVDFSGFVAGAGYRFAL